MSKDSLSEVVREVVNGLIGGRFNEVFIPVASKYLPLIKETLLDTENGKGYVLSDKKRTIKFIGDYSGYQLEFHSFETFMAKRSKEPCFLLLQKEFSKKDYPFQGRRVSKVDEYGGTYMIFEEDVVLLHRKIDPVKKSSEMKRSDGPDGKSDEVPLRTGLYQLPSLTLQKGQDKDVHSVYVFQVKEKREILFNDILGKLKNGKLGSFAFINRNLSDVGIFSLLGKQDIKLDGVKATRGFLHVVCNCTTGIVQYSDGEGSGGLDENGKIFRKFEHDITLVLEELQYQGKSEMYCTGPDGLTGDRIETETIGVMIISLHGILNKEDAILDPKWRGI